MSAKSYFQNHASVIAYPSIAAINNTKSDISGNDIYPDWDKAKLLLDGDFKTIQVPLDGPCKIIGGIAHVHEGKIQRLKTTTRSFLILKYHGNQPSPEMFIATILDYGRGFQLMDYISSKDLFEGMIITSELEGSTRGILLYEHGIEKSIEIGKIAKGNSKVFPNKVSGFLFRLAITAPSTKGGDYGNNIEVGYNEIVCYRCGRTYYGHIWTPCPDCGYCDYYNYLYCGNCLELLEDCICGDYVVCPYCNRLIGLTCTCEGGLCPETPDPEK